MILAAAVLAVVVYNIIADRGPKYRGQTVSYWFEEYCRSGQFMRYDNMRHEEAEDALRHLGTNAVPYLLKETFDTNFDSPARSNYIRLIGSLPRSWGVKAPLPSQARMWEGPMALQQIKPPARMILPFLKAQYRITNSPQDISRGQAIFVMGCLGEGGEEAVPDLSAALQDAYPWWVPQMAMQSLDWLGPRAAGAVPALVTCLESSNSRYGWGAVRALGSIGVNDPAAIRVVGRMFEKETNWNLKCMAATALCRMDTNQTQAMNFLVYELKNRIPATDRMSVAQQLAQIGTNAQAAVPALTEVVATSEAASNNAIWSYPATWTFAVNALRAAGVPSRTLIEEMRPALHAREVAVRSAAAAEILGVNPADPEALQVLAAMIKENPLFARQAVEKLAVGDPAARKAIPTLNEAAKSDDEDLAEAAKIALRRIEADEGGK